MAGIEEARAISEAATVQNRESPFFREALEVSVVKYCEDNGIGFITYSPLRGGRLHKKLPNHPAVPPIADAHDVTPRCRR